MFGRGKNFKYSRAMGFSIACGMRLFGKGERVITLPLCTAL